MAKSDCVVNLGLYRSGTTTLAAAAEKLGWKTYREFPKDLSVAVLQRFLFEPKRVVIDWWHRSGSEEVLQLVQDYNLLCDGWIALMAFLPWHELRKLQTRASQVGVKVSFVATYRNTAATVLSELQHWVVHDLERSTELDQCDRRLLEESLRKRVDQHHYDVRGLNALPVTILSTDHVDDWPGSLSTIAFDNSSWRAALLHVGVQNANPPLPVQGVLLTLRVEAGAIERVNRLLNGIEQDVLCRYLLVLGLDADQVGNEDTAALKASIRRRPRLETVHFMVNGPSKPFNICRAWHNMAAEAFDLGADWVVLLGDDVEIQTNYHYRAFYRAFLDISEALGCPFGFGCPWWNDSTFPGFPTFPVVGKAHFEIFGGLIPEHRRKAFVNQDLDPYLQRLYLQYGAAPPVEATLTNHCGGNDVAPARYARIAAKGWRDWVLQDSLPIRTYLMETSSRIAKIDLVDVVVPSYRVDVQFLQRICSLKVPSSMRTTFIIVVDNPSQLIAVASKLGGSMDSPASSSPNAAALLLEKHLVQHSAMSLGGLKGNSIRVRCNASNLGASASRNRGLDESSAEYVLFLDDDVVPEPDLLEEYGKQLDCDPSMVGLVGLVRFPRSPSLPLKHAAILMSYLVFMFEIAENPLYRRPVWGVTASLLVKRTRVRFDIAYAKTGGGEDVDFCLRLTEETKGCFVACPSAVVTHPFWRGSIIQLGMHFFNWAIGDSALFTRFPIHTYRSWPNAVEFFLLLLLIQLGSGQSLVTWLTAPLFVAVDVLVEASQGSNLRHRFFLLKYPRSRWFRVRALILADLYVLVLETGRLWGHCKRGEFWHCGRRFDWHCGRLEHARVNFQRRERTKFILFCTIVLLLV